MAPYETTCSCHFTEGGVWDLKTSESAWDSNNFNPFVQPSTKVKGDLNPGVDCVACHDPHTTELRVNGSKLCGSCHNGQGTSPQFDPTTGFALHHPNHPTYEHLKGEPFGEESQWIAGEHPNNKVIECTDCHGAHEFTFDAEKVASQEECSSCHNASGLRETVNESVADFQQEYDEVYSMMEEKANSLGVNIHGGDSDHPRDFTQDYQDEKTKLAKAVFYLEFITGEGSFKAGVIDVHNEPLGKKLLGKAEALLEDIDVPSDTKPQITISIVTEEGEREVGKSIQIKATYDGEPIESANITVSDQVKETNEDGVATLSFASEGQYEITANHPDYQANSKTISVVESFEGQVSEQLSSLDSKLSSIQDTVSAIEEDLKETPGFTFLMAIAGIFGAALIIYTRNKTH
ncbi:MAG: Multiheme cytochrome [Candidatus Methanohalarchaeum thermophilum]|uniref:Multiheme cytochrome n=1 Tax=Methanohalarchaeum thermophilum TaxID=1903181 RepID=A0A1Q6DUL2_METT1|nr:MAG: Multiheme cytochrome [Candidatus Methanohalarchaeum thermophilum]